MVIGDHDDLADFGYEQQLHRSLGTFASFAAGFSFVSILTTIFQLFGLGFGFGGPAFTVVGSSPEALVTVQDGVAAGEFHTDEVAMTANAISGMCVDVARWYEADARWTPERIADHFADIALRMVSSS